MIYHNEGSLPPMTTQVDGTATYTVGLEVGSTPHETKIGRNPGGEAGEPELIAMGMVWPWRNLCGELKWRMTNSPESQKAEHLRGATRWAPFPTRLIG